LLLSVLAVLAFACSPALAHAEEATGPVYEPEVPTVPQEQSPGGGGGHHNGPGGGSHAGISNTPGENGTGGGKTPGAGGGSHTGQGSQGSEGNGSQSSHGEKNPKGGVVENQTIANPAPGNSGSAEGDSSSSPLVPILIAIVVLAAISIGAFYYRQRRHGAGSSVSPKAS
jgi:hypothetical protein